VWEFVVRRFLASCSSDAEGRTTTVQIEIAGEHFSTSGAWRGRPAVVRWLDTCTLTDGARTHPFPGLVVLARNYLDVYPYDRWATSTIPDFQVGETFVPDVCELKEGQTTQPSLLTEADLVSLMDKNGIGERGPRVCPCWTSELADPWPRPTTMLVRHGCDDRRAHFAHHRPRVLHDAAGGDDKVPRPVKPRHRPRRRLGQDRPRSLALPSSSPARSARSSHRLDAPTRCDSTFAEAHSGLQTEHRMQLICDGQQTKADVLAESIEQYKEVFRKGRQDMRILFGVSPGL